MASQHEKDPMRVAAGLKAATHNPTLTKETKENAAQRLQEMNNEGGDNRRTYDNKQGRSDTRGGARRNDEEDDIDEGGEPNRVLGGYKATLKNPRVSDEAKDHAEQVLRDNDAL